MNANNLKAQLTEIALERVAGVPDLWPSIREQLIQTRADSPQRLSSHPRLSQIASETGSNVLSRKSSLPLLGWGLMIALTVVLAFITMRTQVSSPRYGSTTAEDSTPTSLPPTVTPDGAALLLAEPIPNPERPTLVYTITMPDGQAVEASTDFIPLIPSSIPEGFSYSNLTTDKDTVTMTFHEGEHFIQLTEIVGAFQKRINATGEPHYVEQWGLNANVQEVGDSLLLTMKIPSGIGMYVELMTNLTFDQAVRVLGSIAYPDIVFGYNETLPDGSSLVFSARYVPLIPTVLPEGFTYSHGLTSGGMILPFKSADGKDYLQIAEYPGIGFDPLPEANLKQPIYIFGSPAAITHMDGYSMLIWRTMDGTRIELLTSLPIDEAIRVARGLIYATPRFLPHGHD